MPEEAPLVIGFTGASGAPIAVAALRALHAAGAPVVLVVTHAGEEVLKEEVHLSVEDLRPFTVALQREGDLGAAIASGSGPTRGMVVVPCSSNTVAKIALGLADTLVTRAAHVHLKERRKLVIVPRETPLSTVQLEHLARLSALGVVVLDAAPPYYLGFERVEQATNYLAGKILDQFGIPHRLYRGWRQGAP